MSSHIWHNPHRLWGFFAMHMCPLVHLALLVLKQVQCALSLLLSAMHWLSVTCHLSGDRCDCDKCKGNKSTQPEAQIVLALSSAVELGCTHCWGSKTHNTVFCFVKHMSSLPSLSPRFVINDCSHRQFQRRRRTVAERCWPRS